MGLGLGLGFRWVRVGVRVTALPLHLQRVLPEEERVVVQLQPADAQLQGGRYGG